MRRHGPDWSVWRLMSWETLSGWAFPRSLWTGGPALRCFIARCIRGAARRSAFRGKTFRRPGSAQKTFIAPDSLDFRQSRTFRIGQYWGAVSYLQIMASELSDKLLAEILELDAEMTVTMHIQTVDQLKAIKTIKGKIADIGKNESGGTEKGCALRL